MKREEYIIEIQKMINESDTRILAIVYGLLKKVNEKGSSD